MRINDTDDIFKIMKAVLMRDNKHGREKEHFWVIGLNKQQILLYIELVALGKGNVVAVEPMDIYSLALQKKTALIPPSILRHFTPGNRPYKCMAKKSLIVDQKVFDELRKSL